MHKNYRKYGRNKRLIQYAIEIFDLVEVSPDTSIGKPVVRRFVQPDALSVPRYGEVQNPTLHVGSNP